MTEKHVATSYPTAPHLVLLIEDEADQLTLLSQLISLPVRQAQTLSQGLDLLRREAFVCCVLDLGLPDSQGLQTLQALRQAAPDLPILVLSGDDTLKTATQAMDLGAWDYMAKATSPPELVARKVSLFITALNEQREAKAHRDELSAIVNSAADGIITADEYGAIRSFNPSAEAMFGWAAQEIIGQNVSCLMPAERAALHDDYLARYRSHGPSPITGKALELVGQRKDGTPFPLRLAISEVVINGQILLTAIISDLTALKQAQNMAERLRERLGESIEALSDGFALFGPNDRLVICNAAFRALFAEDDYLPEGTSFEDVMRAALKRGTFPDALGREKEWLAQQLQSHRVGGVQELRMGEQWIRVADRRLPDGCCVGVYTDVTLLKQSEERLRLSQGYANIGTWDWNIQTGDLFWSERIAPLFGYKVGELETSYDNFLAAIHPEDRNTVTHAVTACIEQGKPYDIEHRVAWPDGTVRWLLERGDVVRDHMGVPLHMLGVVQDITVLKESQAALEESNFTLEAAKQEAERANKAKSEFLSSMSHELRTPLNAILGFAQLLKHGKKDPLSEPQKTKVGHIIKGGEYLLSLINEILDLSRIEAGKLSLAVEPLDARILIDDCLLTIKNLPNPHEVTIEDKTEGETSLPCIKADPLRFRQVLLNLLSNAIKYNRPNGQVRIHAEQVEGPLGAHFLRLCVSDTGLGIPANRLSELFQPFSRLGKEEGGIEGTGIGLTITRKLVEEMGGTVDVSSVVGDGSSFCFTIPIVETLPDVPSETQEGAVALPAPSLTSHKRILCIEDNAANRTLLEKVFDAFGSYTVTFAATGEEGVELALCQPPDVILMDIHLPGINGFEALDQLRSYPETASIPVIGLSADAMPDTLSKGAQMGFSAWISKPLNLGALFRTLAEVLEKSARQERPPS